MGKSTKGAEDGFCLKVSQARQIPDGSPPPGDGLRELETTRFYAKRGGKKRGRSKNANAGYSPVQPGRQRAGAWERAEAFHAGASTTPCKPCAHPPAPRSRAAFNSSCPVPERGLRNKFRSWISWKARRTSQILRRAQGLKANSV